MEQRGAAMLETALVVITFLCMVLFILDMGRILLFDQLLGERIRVAARSAAVRSYDAGDIENYLCYNSLNAPGGDRNSPGFFGLKPAMVTVQRLGTPGKWDDRIRVTIQDYPVVTMIPGFSGSFKLKPVSATIPVASLGSTL
jgi:Flp pilus assembly protein TadG